jgi:hypothetical protein
LISVRASRPSLNLKLPRPPPPPEDPATGKKLKGRPPRNKNLCQEAPQTLPPPRVPVRLDHRREAVAQGPGRLGGAEGPAAFPSTVRTDGVPMEIRRVVPTDVVESMTDGKERRSNDPDALKEQLGRVGSGRGMCTELAAATMIRLGRQRPRKGSWGTGPTSAWTLDKSPSYVSPVTGSNGYKLTRQQFYLGRLEAQRRMFDPGGGGGGAGAGVGNAVPVPVPVPMPMPVPVPPQAPQLASWHLPDVTETGHTVLQQLRTLRSGVRRDFKFPQQPASWCGSGTSLTDFGVPRTRGEPSEPQRWNGT